MSNELDEEFDDDLGDLPDDYEECPKCGGSGLTIEGWDCAFCLGDGYIAI
jgi:hypothetical protein